LGISREPQGEVRCQRGTVAPGSLFWQEFDA
jgi:hypothetical protein